MCIAAQIHDLRVVARASLRAMPTNPMLKRTVRLDLRTIMRAWAYYFLQTTIMRSMSIQDSEDSDIDEPESQ